MTVLRSVVLLAASALAVSPSACAPTEPLPPAPDEVLVTVNAIARTLTVIPTAAITTKTTIPLGATNPTPMGIDALNGIALVPLGKDNAVAVVDLGAGTVLHTWPLGANSWATGAAIVDDSIGYVANPRRGNVTRINYLTGDTASVAVGVHPQAIAFTRGRVFVLNANTDTAGVPLGESWISVIDPVTNALATGIDSIDLPGPGGARTVTVGAEGLLYVMNAGDSASGEGRLSIVNPVTRLEAGNFGGFGNAPGQTAVLGTRLFATNWGDGLMEFDTHLREIVHGAGDAVSAPHASGVAVGEDGRIFTIEAGNCAAADGQLVVRRSDLTVRTTTAAGACPLGLLRTSIPAP